MAWGVVHNEVKKVLQSWISEAHRFILIITTSSLVDFLILSWIAFLGDFRR
jgi:hypothetical protein